MAPPEVVSMKPCPLVPAFVERPLLFSTPMVLATLREDDPKTQTRRVVKPQPRADQIMPREWGAVMKHNPHAIYGDGLGWNAIDESGKDHEFRCPYGQPGERLWVRETYFAFGRWETRFSAKKGRDEWHFVDMTVECGRAYRYAADGDGLWPMPGRRQLAGATPEWWKRPAIFMPRAANRITLEVTGVCVERLQDISAADAKAEGIEGQFENGPWRNYSRDGYWFPEGKDTAPVLSYRSLWEQINGAGSWAANPWVWCVSFRRIRP